MRLGYFSSPIKTPKSKRTKHPKLKLDKRKKVLISTRVWATRSVCKHCDDFVLHYRLKGIRRMVCKNQVSGLRLQGYKVEYDY